MRKKLGSEEWDLQNSILLQSGKCEDFKIKAIPNRQLQSSLALKSQKQLYPVEKAGPARNTSLLKRKCFGRVIKPSITASKVGCD